ncbi:MAG: hypothetical protein ACM3X1_03825 [Ignavibacteriales bacterium]
MDVGSPQKAFAVDNMSSSLSKNVSEMNPWPEGANYVVHSCMPAISSNLRCVGPNNQIGMDFRVILEIPLYITKKK